MKEEGMTPERKQVKTPPVQAVGAKEDDDEAIDDSHNWRGIAISLLVIAAICSIIALAIILLTPKNSGAGQKGNRLSLNEILSGEFVPRRFNGSWISDDLLEFRDKDGNLVMYSAKSKITTQLVSNLTFIENNIRKYSLSADLQYVLMLYNVTKIYRYSFNAKYEILDIAKKKIYLLEPKEEPGASLRYAAWGPTGNQLVYVYGNNIYYVDSVIDTHYQITSTGVEGVIFNGVTDWLYEEEILFSNSALWWSQNGNFLCFATFNDSKLGSFYYDWYGNINGTENIYPKLLSLRYPKPGQNNPSAFLWVSDLRNPSKILQRDVKPPRDVQDQLVHVWDHYFTSVRWVDNHSLAVIWMARSQNFSVVTKCTGTLWYCTPIYEQRPPSRKGWVDLYDAPVFDKDGHGWFLKLPLPQGIHGHYRHLAVVYNDSRHVDYLTDGRFDITKILAYHFGTHTVFYQATKENRPGERHLYSIVFSGKKTGSTTHPKCLTCDEGFACLYNTATFSPKAEFYVLECLGPGVPRIEIRSIYDETFEILDGNNELREKVQRKTLPQIRTFQVEIRDNYKAQVRLFLPPELADDEILSYPLIVQGCGAPGSQLVSSEFSVHWGTYLSSKRNFIYAWVDGRGSGYQGDKLLHETYFHLGAAEVEDQIKVIRYLRDNLPFINPNQIAIWGWDYGGYVAATALAADNTVFNCAISIAPITNWLDYNSAFTERYMGMPEPQENFLGYEKANLVLKAPGFKGKKFLLVHGTADDKVHIQHSAMLMKALVKEGVIFHTQIYPDEAHALTNVRRHLYRTMEDFLLHCFSSKRKDDFKPLDIERDASR